MSVRRAGTSTLPLGEAIRNEAKGAGVTSVDLSGQRLGEDISGVVDTRDANQLGETRVEAFVDRVGANAGVFRPLLHVE